ncbi:hypothetical protein CTT31_04140 [Pseudoalteromonas maricaloris]|nr:hypothetical protein CTT31_04140 [Pseudoalteromonas flavipulchra]
MAKNNASTPFDLDKAADISTRKKLGFIALLLHCTLRRSPFMATSNASAPFVFSVALDRNTIQAKSLSLNLTKN